MVVTEPSLLVHEIYASLQGESTYAGLPCVLVRLTGCNLRCTYCDTEYAFYEGKRMPVDAVVEAVKGFGIGLVEITGGEPLLQHNCIRLTEELMQRGMTVLVETSGAHDISSLPAGVIRIMDIKCPSSGECEKTNWENVGHLTPSDEVKFVIGDRNDYEWARGVITARGLSRRCKVLVSTVYGALEPQNVVDWILADKLNVRFQLQMHKYIWSPETRGV